MLNPFEPPQSDSPLIGTRDVDYEVNIRPYDLRCRPPLFVRIVLIACLGMSIYSAVVVLPRLNSMSISTLVFAGMGLVFTACIARITYRYAGPGFAKARIAVSPSLLGLQRGTLSNQWVTRENEGGKTRYRSSYCSYAAMRGDVLELSFDRVGLALHVIPGRCISPEDMQALRKTFRSYQIESKQYRTALGDRRNLEENCVEPEGDDELDNGSEQSVEFSGVITSADTGNLSNQIRRAQRKILLLIAGFSIFAIGVGLTVGMLMFCFAAALIVGIILLRRLLIIRRFSSSSGHPITKFRGKISPTHLTVATPGCWSQSPLGKFSFAGSSGDVLALNVQGNSGAMILIPRRFFDSESDWQTALSLAESGCI